MSTDKVMQEVELMEVDAAAAGTGTTGDLEVPFRQDDQTARLLQDLTLEDERPAGSAYSYDRELAETGRWVRWPKLGPEAHLRIAKTHNRRYTELWDKANQKYADRKGTMKLDKRLELLPVINGKTLLTGIRGVRFVDAKTGEVLREMESRDHRGQPVTLGFEVSDAVHQPSFDGAPALKEKFYVEDTLNNRVNVLRLFQPDLGNDVFTYANDEDHYFDREPDEETRGN